MDINLQIYATGLAETSAILSALQNAGIEVQVTVDEPAKEEPKEEPKKEEEPKEEPKKAEEPKKEEEPVKAEPKKIEEPKEEPKKEEKSAEISDKDIREAILKIGKELGKDAAKELLAKYDAPSAAKVPQDKRAAMVAEIEEMLNA